MIDRLNENLKKKDLDLILEVNKKAIDIEMEVVEQNEEVLEHLSDLKKEQKNANEKIDKIYKQSEETSRELFRIQVLFLTGLLSLVLQVIQLFAGHK